MLVRPLTEIEILEDKAMRVMLTPQEAVLPSVSIDWSGPRRKVAKAVRAAKVAGKTHIEALRQIISSKTDK